jgi:hypothetical protein
MGGQKDRELGGQKDRELGGQKDLTWKRLENET